MITGVSHIGIAVFSIEESLKFYRDILGLSVLRIEEVPHEGVRVAILPVGNARIELLEPLGPDSPFSKILEKRGEGIHHLALETDNLNKLSDSLSKNGVKMLGDPRGGAGGSLITFIHPKSAHGVLMELCQEK